MAARQASREYACPGQAYTASKDAAAVLIDKHKGKYPRLIRLVQAIYDAVGTDYFTSDPAKFLEWTYRVEVAVAYWHMWVCRLTERELTETPLHEALNALKGANLLHLAVHSIDEIARIPGQPQEPEYKQKITARLRDHLPRAVDEIQRRPLTRTRLNDILEGVELKCRVEHLDCRVKQVVYDDLEKALRETHIAAEDEEANPLRDQRGHEDTAPSEQGNTQQGSQEAQGANVAKLPKRKKPQYGGGKPGSGGGGAGGGSSSGAVRYSSY